MEKNEIVINGVHHVLVKNKKKGDKCHICSLSKACRTSRLNQVIVKKKLNTRNKITHSK